MIELLGIVASLFVIAAFAFKNVKVIRILDGIGAILYVIYGFLIHSYANVLLNTVLIFIQIYHLYKLNGEKRKDLEN